MQDAGAGDREHLIINYFFWLHITHVDKISNK